MPIDDLTTRRSVVATGVKLAYAAPLVAATMKLSAQGAFATVSGAAICPPGRVREAGECVPCAKGTYSSDGTVCAPCLPGFYSDVTGAVACSPCPAGTFADQPGTVVCTACSQGYCAEHEGSVACESCAP